MCQIALLAVIGCSGSPETASTTMPAVDTTQSTTATVQETVSDSVPGDGEAVTLVSLKVPNMH